MTVLVDSCVWIEYFQGSKKGEKARKYIEGDYAIIVSSINLSEVYRFMLSKKGVKEADNAINFIAECSFSIPVFDDIALFAAQLKHEHKFGLGDALVYSTALINKAELITFDSDFKNFDNAVFLK